MNKLRIVCIILCMQVLSLLATNEELFLQGNKLYKEQQWGSALTSYKKIENKGSAVWYAMGSCAYYLGNFKQAISFWVAAERGASWSILKDIDSAIDETAEKLSPQEKKDVAFGRLTSLQKLVAPVSLGILQILFLILLIFGIWWYLFFEKHQKLIAGGCILMAMIVGLCMIIKYITIGQQIGIIETATPLYAGPNEQYHLLENLNQSSIVMINEIKNGWCKIRFYELTGWIQLATVMIV